MQNNGLFNEIIAFFLQVPSHFFFISKIYPDFVALMSVGWGFYMGGHRLLYGGHRLHLALYTVHIHIISSLMAC